MLGTIRNGTVRSRNACERLTTVPCRAVLSPVVTTVLHGAARHGASRHGSVRTVTVLGERAQHAQIGSAHLIKPRVTIDEEWRLRGAKRKYSN